MGTGIDITCMNCDYRKSLLTGKGMIYIPGILQNIESEDEFLSELIQSKKQMDNMKKLIINENAEIVEHYGYDIYHCPVCSDFFYRPYFGLINNEISYEISYDCPRCNVEMIKISDSLKGNSSEHAEKVDFSKFCCPKCGKYDSFLIENFLWD